MADEQRANFVKIEASKRPANGRANVKVFKAFYLAEFSCTNT